MRILIEAHHPAHIHFWKYPIREMQRLGHRVRLIGRDRDVMKRLLEVYDWIEAVIPPRRQTRNRFPFLEMLQRQYLVAREIQRFRPDVVASLMGSYTQSAKLFGVRNVIFTDSEFQHFNHRIAHPFADAIYTPECFCKELGHKQIRYQGIHEMMFLRKGVFDPDPSVLKRYGDLVPGEFIILRISAWNTLHDIGARGIGDELERFIDSVQGKYRIVASVEESAITRDLGIDLINPQPEDFHSLLYYARLVLTEGASTASEAGCLAVPTVYVNSTGDRGYLRMLQAKHDIVHCYSASREGLVGAVDWLNSIEGINWNARETFQSQLSRDLPDGSGFVVNSLLGNSRIGI